MLGDAMQLSSCMHMISWCTRADDLKLYPDAMRSEAMGARKWQVTGTGYSSGV